MIITDTKRFELHQYLREQMGTEMADTLMEHLPPAGWSDLASSSDISNLRTEMVDRFATQTRWFLGFMVTNIAAMTALVVSVILKV